MRKSNLIGAVLSIAAAATMTACSSDSTTAPAPVSSGTATPTTAAGDSTADLSSAAPASSTASTSGGGDLGASGGPGGSDSNSANCTATELSVTLGATTGAAGSTQLPVTFTNTGNRTCTLDGYPGISYVSSQGGAQVGRAAVRTGSEVSPVELTPGHQAVAAVKATVVQNYSSDLCKPTPVSGIDVYSPNTTEVVYLPYPTTGCGSSDPSITQLSVQPVAAG